MKETKKNGAPALKVVTKRKDKILDKLISEILIPKSPKSKHWRTWIASLRSNNAHGFETDLEEWLRRFKPKDLKTLRSRFDTFYDKNNQFDKKNYEKAN